MASVETRQNQKESQERTICDIARTSWACLSKQFPCAALSGITTLSMTCTADSRPGEVHACTYVNMAVPAIRLELNPHGTL